MAAWRAGQFERGLEPYAEILITHPAIDKIISAGPCCVLVFDVLVRQYVFCSQAALAVHRCQPNVLLESNYEYFKAHLTAQDLHLFGKRALRYHQKSVHFTVSQRLNTPKMHLYTLHFPDAPSQVMIGQDLVLKCDNVGAPYLILSVAAIADTMPDLAERLQQQTLDDNEVDTPIHDISRPALERYFQPQEAQLIYLMALGKGTPQVAEEMNLPMLAIMRMLKDILKRTQCYSIVELLDKRVWETPRKMNMPVW